jgi:signal transduction histidine kinase
MSIETFAIAEVINGVINVLKPIADKKQILISQKLSSEIDIINLDKSKLRQILFNLLSNAIKFSTNNSEVLIETEPLGIDNFTLTVSDTGIGISAEDQKKLFIPFVQLDTRLGRQYEGSGLGLALTKNIVTLHGGEINVKSTLGEGSTFSVTLPFILKKEVDHDK